MKDELQAKLIAADANNPLKLTTEEMNKRVQEVCTAWYNRQSKCEVVAYPVHFMPSYGCEINGSSVFPFQSVVVMNDGSGWKHAVDINITTTRELLPPEREPDGRVTRTPLYMVDSISLDFCRAGRDALEPKKPTGR